MNTQERAYRVVAALTERAGIPLKGNTILFHSIDLVRNEFIAYEMEIAALTDERDNLRQAIRKMHQRAKRARHHLTDLSSPVTQQVAQKAVDEVIEIAIAAVPFRPSDILRGAQ